MACDVGTVENLLAANGYFRLSQRDTLMCLAGVFAVTAGITAQQGVTNAASNGYAKLSDLQLDEALLAALSASACDAQTLVNQSRTQKYPSLSRWEILLAQIASWCAVSGGTAQASETLLAANGYFKFSRDDAEKALLAVNCSGSCSAQTLLTQAYSRGMAALSERSLKEVLLAAACAAGATPPTPTGFAYTLAADGSVINVTWDALPGSVTKTEVWTSSDNVTFALETTVNSPGTSTTSAVPAASATKYAKIRWCNNSTCGSFTAVQSVTGAAVVTNAWGAQVVTNGGAAPSNATKTAITTFLTSISSLISRIYHMNIVAPDSFIAMRTPLIATVGSTLWTRLNIGTGGTGESLTVNGWLPGGDRNNCQIYDTGIVPSTVAAWTNNAGGAAVYISTNATTNSISNGVLGTYDGTRYFDIRPDLAGFNTAACFVWDAVAGTSSASDHGGGFFLCSRQNNTETLYQARSNLAWGSIGTVNQAGGGQPTTHCYAGGDNYPAGGSHGSAVRYSFFCWCDGFSSADGQTLFNAVQALRVALGGGNL